jgi:L-asparaginase
MTDKLSAVHYIMTGGTIDSYFEGSKDAAVPFKKSIIPSFIKNLKLYQKAIFTTAFMKDSRDITKKDMAKVLQIIKKSTAKKILITHGTYTMPDTARFLKANLEHNNKTIILTASMIPIVGFSPSDGPFSLGYAVAQLEHLKPGVYIAINGRIFAPEEVAKIIKEARFTSIFEKR